MKGNTNLAISTTLQMYVFFAPVIPRLDIVSIDTYVQERKAMCIKSLIAALLTT